MRPLPPGHLINKRYEILETLGSGGMGIVYLALDRELEERVALKVLRGDVANAPGMAARLRSEIKLARRVTHRHVCRIYEYGRDEHLSYIVMEIVTGRDLKHLLREGGPLSPDKALVISIQLADALHAIHEVGVLHRDLKTANVMLDQADSVRLMDFGIAKVMSEGVGQGVTHAGSILGTPEYMSPEQARGAVLDARSDVYALGIVIFELFTGDVPFRGDTPITTLYKQMEEPPSLTGRVPDALTPLLARMLAKKPGDRPQSAAEVARELGLLTGSLAASAKAPRPEGLPVSRALPTPASGATNPVAPARLAVAAAVRPRPFDDAPPTEAGITLEARGSSETEVLVVPATMAPGLTQLRSPAVPRADPRRPARRIVLLSAVLGAVAVATGIGWWSRHVSEIPPQHASPAPLQVSPSQVPAAAQALPDLAAATPQVAESAAELPMAPRAWERLVPSSTVPPGPGGRGRAAPAASPEAASPRPEASPAQLAAAETQQPVNPTVIPAPAVARPSEIARIHVKADPWAAVALDGAVAGMTPLDLELAPGEHRLVLSHPDFEPYRRVVRAVSGARISIGLNWNVDGVRKVKKP